MLKSPKVNLSADQPTLHHKNLSKPDSRLRGIELKGKEFLGGMTTSLTSTQYLTQKVTK